MHFHVDGNLFEVSLNTLYMALSLEVKQTHIKGHTILTIALFVSVISGLILISYFNFTSMLGNAGTLKNMDTVNVILKR